MKNSALRISAVIFFIIAALHALRLIFNVGVSVNGLTVPQWVSAVGFALAAALAAWMFKESK